MCADDVVCTGAEPLFFLDYVAVGRVVPEQVAELVAGVAEGCRRAGCALLGGETAEHPGRDARRPVRPRGVLRGHRGGGRSARPRAGPRGRRADRAAVERAARERVLARAARPARRQVAGRPGARARAVARRRAARAVRDPRAGGPGDAPRRACSTPRPTSPAAASSRTSLASCPTAWARPSIGGAGASRRSSPCCNAKPASPTRTSSGPSTWASGWCSRSRRSMPRPRPRTARSVGASSRGAGVHIVVAPPTVTRPVSPAHPGPSPEDVTASRSGRADWTHERPCPWRP